MGRVWEGFLQESRFFLRHTPSRCTPSPCVDLNELNRRCSWDGHAYGHGMAPHCGLPSLPDSLKLRVRVHHGRLVSYTWGKGLAMLQLCATVGSGMHVHGPASPAAHARMHACALCARCSSTRCLYATPASRRCSPAVSAAGRGRNCQHGPHAARAPEPCMAIHNPAHQAVTGHGLAWNATVHLVTGQDSCRGLRCTSQCMRNAARLAWCPGRVHLERGGGAWGIDSVVTIAEAGGERCCLPSLLALPCVRADLVFYSGTYYNPETKAHAFSMTHVEVFVGGASGRATIGEPGRAVHAYMHAWSLVTPRAQTRQGRVPRKLL